ncbi:MAG: hypothetical protein JSS02_32805 [Planctomycetes bacterium]|nr:hypothetical protein [Planctomycetota bacterium]
MKRLALLVAVACGVWGMSASAQATPFSFEFSDGTNEGQVNLSYTVYQTYVLATSGTLTITNSSDPLAVGTYNLVPNPNAPATSQSAFLAFTYDDLLYPSSDPDYIVHSPGLLFQNVSSDGPLLVNFFHTDDLDYFGNGNYSLWTYYAGTYPEPGYYGTITNSVTIRFTTPNPPQPPPDVPEPAGFVVFSVAAGLLVVRRWARS